MLLQLNKSQKIRVISPHTVFEIMRDILLDKHPFDRDKEHFWCIHLNRRNTITNIDEVSIGNLVGTIATPREVFRWAIVKGAHSIMVVHNHPSGDVSPSESDKAVTKQICQAGKIIQIEVMDSIIISEEYFYSFTNEGMLY